MKKLLKTKNFLIGFIILMISIIPISTASALELSDGTIVPDVRSDRPNYVITTKSDGTIRMFCWTDSSEVYVYSVNGYLYFSQVHRSDYMSYISHKLVAVYVLSNGEWVGSGFTSGSSFGYQTINATTDNIYNKDLSVYYEAGYGLANKTPEISFQTNFLEEYINGRDVYSITSMFSNVEGSDYTYQIKTDYTDWTTIALNSNYEYEYYLEHNSKFYARILDSSGNTVLENQVDITGLNDFGITIDKFGYGDDQGRELAQFIINFENCWDESFIYQYSFNNVDFVDIDVGEERKYKLYQGINTDIYFRILDSSENVIYTLKDEKLTKYGNYSWLYDVIERNVIIKEDTSINDDKEKEIIISVDFSEFSQFSDMYDLKFYIDDKLIDGDNKTLIYTEENFVTGFYIKIELDGIELKNYSHRIAASGSGGGSDSSFNDTYDNVIDNNLSAELGEQDYTSVEGLFDVVKNFINAVSSYIIIFFDLIMYFFNGLNPWLRNAIISLFVVLVISKIIKVVRR